MRLPALFGIALLAACTPTETDTITPAAPPAPVVEVEPTAPEVSAATAPRLEQVWLIDGFAQPEGVAVYGDTLLISNISGEVTEKDGEGWISRVSMNGEVLEAKWVEGLNAPKGMAVRGNILFVADIDEYHTINADTGEILNTFAIEGSKFLNDVTVWGGGVYASDSGDASIYQLDENGSKRWLEDERLDGVNGLLGMGDDLIISTMTEGLLLSASGGRTLTGIATGMTNGDGIAALPGGEYLVSSWPGQIWHVSDQGETTALLDTEADGILQNDLTGVGELIVVPNLNPGTVTAWRLVRDE